ncbi:MAG: Lrp/AsnC family transcriptional regulator [Devosiaceae bacterium]|nr:Lrp/AsnC family transcriptional regulator [Devosiaceae bacterium]
MDALDIRIVEALQDRGDMTHAALADAVGSTASTCLRRLRGLRKSGILTRNIYLADAARLGRGLRAIITAATKDHTRADREILAKCIRAEPAIAYAYGVTGELDAILIGNFRDMVEYQEVCDRLFDGVESVVRYTTHFISETYKDEPAIPCDALRDHSADR